MTKTTLVLAAALLAGTTLNSAANAGGVRVGFGFPLGSFVAHQHQSYNSGYDPDCERPRSRRSYKAPRRVAKTKRAPKPVAVAAKPQPRAKTAKLEDKVSSDPTTTTEIAKTTPAATETTTTTASLKPVKSASKSTTDSTIKPVAAAEAKQICRRYSAAIAGLVDVPCGS